MGAIIDVAHRHGIPVHLDGARVMNAAVAQNIPVSQLVKGIDSVQMCLSKGLGAPVGSVLVGKKDWIANARRWRKMVGGGMRQAGVIAAAGLHALENMVERLADDHHNAARLMEGLGNIGGFTPVRPDIPTNIVVVDVSSAGWTADSFTGALAARGIKSSGFSATTVRFVTHVDVSRDDIDYALGVINEMVSHGPSGAKVGTRY
jgi:threonine aldolase